MNNVRCDRVAIPRITGVKFANSRTRFITLPKKSQQFSPYLAISCRSVANALITWTPAMFSVMISRLRSPASIIACSVGWALRLNRRMYHVQTGSGASASSATHGDRENSSAM